MTYTPRPPKLRGKVLLNKTKPFQVFLKFGGGIYTMHFQLGRLVIAIEDKALRKL